MKEGKTIAVTGSSRGIGYAVVQNCARAGHKVIAVTRNTGCFDNAAPNIHPVYADVTNETGRQQFIEELNRNDIVLDGILHNAGLLIKKDFFQMTEHDMMHMYKVNCITPFMVTRDLLDAGRMHSKSSITAISSIGGVEDSVKFPQLAGYGASKAALNALIQHLAVELGEYHINAIAPGAVETEMQKQAFPNFKPAMNAEDFAKFVSYFITEGYLFFNGQILKVKLDDPK